uniref:Uncharacterized protein n=1 Tax=viral metagenome TaxID=1070528 RepID=A0A6M3KJH2_9ZZZZ
MPDELTKIRTDITTLKSFWSQRNNKFQEWYEILILIDLLKTKGMETYVSNEPQTFYNMAHFLLTRGELSHSTPIENETALELDRKARVNRGCEYLWSTIDRQRQQAGDQSFVDELSFFLLVLGWYSEVMMFDQKTGLLKTQVWNPYDTYPRYSNGRLAACVHSYQITAEDATLKAEENGWDFGKKGAPKGNSALDDFYIHDKEGLHNIILIDNQPVTDWIGRPNMRVLVAPVGGFPDKGSLSKYGSSFTDRDWRRLIGRGIFEVNETVYQHFNKWRSMVTQILRDTAQPITQEFSASPQATPEQLRERGGLFHYAPGEAGLQRIPSPQISPDLSINLASIDRERQKGSFNDAVYGLVSGQSGYSLSLLAGSSANQVLYPYMDAKHFVIGENDMFWLSNLKSSGKVFEVKGKFLEKMQPEDIPDEVIIKVKSDVATPKDWLERGTIGGMLRPDLDRVTLLTEVYGFDDPQAILRRKELDDVMNHPMSQMVKLIAGYYSHADYLDKRGDTRQANLFRRAAQALEAQLGAPAPGQGRPEDMSRVQQEREAGAPSPRAIVPSTVAPPETTGFSPEQLRQSIGRGSLRAI